MEIIPNSAGTDLATQFSSFIGANIVGILAVIFLAVGVRFVWSKFIKALPWYGGDTMTTISNFRNRG